jgi:hypothetical protein
MVDASNWRSGASSMLQNDNWGWQARFGMFIVGNEAVPESEWWAMLPPISALRNSAFSRTDLGR